VRSSDDDLDRILARFRAVGPPPELRARIAGADGGRRFRAARSRVLEWLPAAAAVLLVVLFHWLAANERLRIQSWIVPVPPVDQPAAVLAEFQG